MRRLWMLATALALVGLMGSGPAGAGSVERVAELSGRGFPEGDPDATGRVVLRTRPALNKLCFRITFRRLRNPNHGSLLRGDVHEQYGAELVVTLFNGDAGERSSPIEGCARNVPRRVLREVAERPRQFYVQIDQHTYPNSAARGVIRRP